MDRAATVNDPELAPFELSPEAGAAATLDFVSVYREHFAFVWRSLRRLGVAESALDDATQEVFITVHRRLGEFEGRSSLKTWIFGILRNAARHHRRTIARRREDDPVPETAADPSHGESLDAVARAQAIQALGAFLEGLDDTLRECFILSELEQMTAPEVAAATGANLHTVHSRIRTARQLFEQMVARRRARDPWSRP